MNSAESDSRELQFNSGSGISTWRSLRARLFLEATLASCEKRSNRQPSASILIKAANSKSIKHVDLLMECRRLSIQSLNCHDSLATQRLDDLTSRGANLRHISSSNSWNSISRADKLSHASPSSKEVIAVVKRTAWRHAPDSPEQSTRKNQTEIFRFLFLSISPRLQRLACAMFRAVLRLHPSSSALTFPRSSCHRQITFPHDVRIEKKSPPPKKEEK